MSRPTRKTNVKASGEFSQPSKKGANYGYTYES